MEDPVILVETWEDERMVIRRYPMPELSGIIRRMTFEVNGMPIFSMPFYFHDDAKQLHTICDRNSPEVHSTEW